MRSKREDKNRGGRKAKVISFVMKRFSKAPPPPVYLSLR
jgi:hypothetical protein